MKKPIWYALMYYMQDQYPNEYLRMGEELEETVKEIIDRVEKCGRTMPDLIKRTNNTTSLKSLGFLSSRANVI